MSTIEVLSEPDRDCTTFVVHGVLTAAEIIHTVRQEYPNNLSTNLLWDLTDGRLDPAISADEFRRVAAVTRDSRVRRPGAKTAYVGSADLDFGLMRMYSILAEEAGIQAHYEVFRTRDAAYRWLSGARLANGEGAGSALPE